MRDADEARAIVAQEMDYWRKWMLAKIRDMSDRDQLQLQSEGVDLAAVCAILAAASAQLRGR